MILVNGCKAGIGTGWSTSIPSYNPIDIINCIKDWLNNETIKEITPYYKGFEGSIKKIGDNKYETYGKLVKNGSKYIIQELPVMTWTDKQKEYYEGLLENKKIKSLRNYSTPERVHFEIIESINMSCNEVTLKLTSTLSTNNMVLFKDNMKLNKYNHINEIITDFCEKRYNLYIKRKKCIINTLERELSFLKEKHRFISLVVSDIIIIFKRTEEDVIQSFKDNNFQKIDESYNYLLNININKFTKTYMDKIEEEINNCIKKLKIIRKKSEKKMWLEELDNLQNKLN
jgi:DNA topoisomerase II